MKKFIKDLKVGDVTKAVYFLKKKETFKTKDNKPYLKIILSDKSGTLEARAWDMAEEIDSRLSSGGAVFVKGVVDSWKDNVQLKIDDIRPARPEELNTEDLMRVVENAGQLFENIKKHLETISDEYILSLANKFLEDEIFIENFKRAPGAQSWHNAYIGGLLEHTWEVMSITEKMCDLYPRANRDICMLAAFLHDSGKIFELDPLTFEYTLEGGLIGHLSLGFELLSNKINQVEGFPQDLALYLKHIILSHHGEYHQQSPVLPKTLEATIIYHADDLVSQANAVKELTQNSLSGKNVWSNYISIKNRKYLLGRQQPKKV